MTNGYVHLLYNSRWKIHQLSAGQLLLGNRYGTERAGDTARPSRTKPHLPGSLSSSQPGGPPCRASPLAFCLIAPGYSSISIEPPFSFSFCALENAAIIIFVYAQVSPLNCSPVSETRGQKL